MWKYFRKREGWSELTMKTVDWEHLYMALLHVLKLNWLTTDFDQYTKFMIDMPHTGFQKHTFTEKDQTQPTISNTFP